MKKSEILRQLRIDILGGGTVFIQNRHFNFSYTPMVGENSNGRWIGGLQCNYLEGSTDHACLQRWLVGIAEGVLLTIKGL